MPGCKGVGRLGIIPLGKCLYCAEGGIIIHLAGGWADWLVLSLTRRVSVWQDGPSRRNSHCLLLLRYHRCGRGVCWGGRQCAKRVM